ncbi:hypothetical protein K443DRAFT_577083 [Laccaria amethystina LaAM-08-1]|uniref:Eukaryotic translation initiation factor 4G1 eIF4E-binding domain-containing protein n=1 Tax=Laccaria amethystina LaAM-08-1 TaxID=1095629 RepID=A0A0C9XTX6_9AGAR|nr:hypothetical protein K443DRAFT_577083 [Laccaria amethystina LaAM-08-1]
MSPKPELNANVKHGRFRYDRDFLLQFRGVCIQKPDMLPPLESFGLKPLDQASLGTRGRSGAAAPPRQASVGLSLGPSSGLGKSSPTNLPSMGNFTTSGSNLSSNERFANASQGGADGRDRTRSERRSHRNEMKKAQQGDGSDFNDFQANAQNVRLEPVAPRQVSANRWDRKAIQVDSDSPEIVDRKVKALLNVVETLSDNSTDSHFLCFEGLTADWADCCSWFYSITVSSHFLQIDCMYRTVIGSKQLIWLNMGSNEDACTLRGYLTHRTMSGNSLVVSHFVSEATFQSAVQACTNKWVRPVSAPANYPVDRPSHFPLEEQPTSPNHVPERSASPLRDTSLLQQMGVTLGERVEGTLPHRHQRGGKRHKKKKALKVD